MLNHFISTSKLFAQCETQSTAAHSDGSYEAQKEKTFTQFCPHFLLFFILPIFDHILRGKQIWYISILYPLYILILYTVESTPMIPLPIHVVTLNSALPVTITQFYLKLFLDEDLFTNFP